MRVLTLMQMLLLSSCSLFPAPIVSGHIPPELMQQRLVHGCDEIKNQSKLASCYLKSRRELYISNQDKISLKLLEKKWN